MDCIEVRNVIKRFNGISALDGISFSVPCNGKYALLGPNGAGKSTTLKILSGLLRPDAGEVYIKGMSPTSVEVKRILGYLPEDAMPYRNLTVMENLEYFASLRDLPRERAKEMIYLLGLEDYMYVEAGKLSRGNLQKLSLALVLLHNPEVILLDEPLNYLDIPTQERVINILKSLNGTLLVSTHIMSIATRLTDHVIIINHGKVIWTGSIDELRSLGREDEPIESIVAKIMSGIL
ncbi:ABC transporter ATP-binding protein [Sulfurisphaera ohwakuensis]|uniref:ABC-2 type transport system ATP-binding protein n=1 Tax=Sulfurisphaera ohwakuensis TaxID=69656 RepID=A0A650CJV1_SULOH|nr:ABC transporter ATP-binding protein [Sulfurisphaera ohwakuensis]MBB5254506.1 ABC-2 type transport system ATP-binding protein [Sulfurisphaera ohwakuensis]QGR18120.1 ATP-binding cassette domain-containing protein [Sulfurisphaera ohwakuensis]